MNDLTDSHEEGREPVFAKTESRAAIIDAYNRLIEDAKSLIAGLEDRLRLHREHGHEQGVRRVARVLEVERHYATLAMCHLDLLRGRWEDDDRAGFRY